MSGYSELAELFYERNNLSEYTPMIGKIVDLQELKIKLGTNVFLYNDDIESTFDIYEKIYDSEGNEKGYKNLGKEVIVLPMKNNKYAVIGVIQ